MSVGLKLHPSLSVISTCKAQSLALLTYSFVPKGSYFSTESAKFGAFKKKSYEKKTKNL